MGDRQTLCSMSVQPKHYKQFKLSGNELSTSLLDQDLLPKLSNKRMMFGISDVMVLAIPI